ncbi:MAG: hypothetical protein QM686_20380 [Herbaspirillum sp.]
MYTKTNYADKLKDPRWQKKRLEVMQRDHFTCQDCGDKETTLNVHHLTYNGSNPWDTDINQLVTLCESCHESESTQIPEALQELNKTIKSIGMSMDVIYFLSYALKEFKITDDNKFSDNRGYLINPIRAFFLIVDKPEEIKAIIEKHNSEPATIDPDNPF